MSKEGFLDVGETFHDIEKLSHELYEGEPEFKNIFNKNKRKDGMGYPLSSREYNNLNYTISSTPKKID